MIFYERDVHAWSDYDFKLIEAYQILQDETCPTCGNPIWICRSEDSNIRFKMQNTTCFADREQQLWEKRQKKKNKDWEPRAGEQWFPVVVSENGGPLPGRDEYYATLADRIE